jgi:hypothetical protein
MKRAVDVPGPAPDARKGWKAYSETTKNLVLTMSSKFDGLFKVDEKNMIVRLTPEGEILNKWMFFAPPKAPAPEKDEGDDGDR